MEELEGKIKKVYENNGGNSQLNTHENLLCSYENVKADERILKQLF